MTKQEADLIRAAFEKVLTQKDNMRRATSYNSHARREYEKAKKELRDLFDTLTAGRASQ